MLPNVFPLDAIKTVIGYLRGQITDTGAVVDACHTLLGFGLSLLFPTPGLKGAPPEPYRVSEPNLTRAEMANALEAEISKKQSAVPHEGASLSQFTLPPWIIPLALQLIQELIASLQKKGG